MKHTRLIQHENARIKKKSIQNWFKSKVSQQPRDQTIDLEYELFPYIPQTQTKVLLNYMEDTFNVNFICVKFKI